MMRIAGLVEVAILVAAKKNQVLDHQPHFENNKP